LHPRSRTPSGGSFQLALDASCELTLDSSCELTLDGSCELALDGSCELALDGSCELALDGSWDLTLDGAGRHTLCPLGEPRRRCRVGDALWSWSNGAVTLPPLPPFLVPAFPHRPR
jgi:hypothetical protein